MTSQPAASTTPPPTFQTNVVVDLSHWNSVSSMATIKASGINGIIHKATQGKLYVDPTFLSRRTNALAAGLWWGAYHFGDGNDPVGQADHFLDSAQPDQKTFVALDLERNPNGPSMSLVQAEQFVSHVHDRLGRWPVLYTGNWYIADIIGDHQSTLLSNCALWIASYRNAPLFPKQWSTWTFWQYTNGHNGPPPFAVSGIGPCDRDAFNGTLDQLAALWGTAPSAPSNG